MLDIAFKAYSIACSPEAVAFSGDFWFQITRPVRALWTLLWLTVVWNCIRNLEMIPTIADGLSNGEKYILLACLKKEGDNKRKLD